MIDLEKILRTYIDHIGEQEGIDFIERGVDGLTDEEMHELKRIAGYPEQCMSFDYDQKVVTVKSMVSAHSFMSYMEKRLPDMEKITNELRDIGDWEIHNFDMVVPSEFIGFSIKSRYFVYVCTMKKSFNMCIKL